METPELFTLLSEKSQGQKNAMRYRAKMMLRYINAA